MKNLLTKIGLIVLIALNVQAADYGIAKTFWNFNGTWTNSTTVATNLLTALDATLISDFALSIVAKGTNNTGGAGSFDVVWDISADGSNFPNHTNQLNGAVGWFAMPYNSNAVTSVFVTNITMNAIGYWRIRTLTNNTGMNFTSVVLRAYAKPKRTSRDY